MASIDYLSTAPHTPTRMVIRGLTFHPTIFNICTRGSYSFVLLLWQYLGPIITLGELYLSRYNMSGLSWAMHVHMLGRHVHRVNHSRVVTS